MSMAGLASLLPLPVAVPLGAAALAPLGARLSGKLPLVISVASLLCSAGLLLAVAPTVYGGKVLGVFMGHWGPVGGAVLGDEFVGDAFGFDFAIACALIGAALLLFTLSEQSGLGKRELGGFTALFLMLDAALIGSALTADLINLFVWFEVAALASYALTAFFLERPIALEAAFKVLVLTNIASFLVFVGVALIYEQTGGVNFGQVYNALHGHVPASCVVALGLLLAGFATKAGLVPFHGWLPDAHTAAPGPVSALFSGLMVNLGIVSIARVVFQLFTPGQAHHALGLLMVLGLVSAVGGSFFALLQDDLKRLLAYDTVSQMGVLCVGLATGSPVGVAGASYHLVSHALFKSLLFLCAGSIVHATGADKLSEMGGLARRMPGVAAGFTLGAIAISGLPPLNGYAGVGMVHEALLKSHQYVPYGLMVLAQVITVGALGKATWQAFFRRPQRDSYERDERLRPGMLMALVGLGGGCVAFGVLPSVLLPDMVVPAASSLLHPGLFAHALLASHGLLPQVKATFDYFDPVEILTAVAIIFAALPLARSVLSRRAHKVVTLVRRIQTGLVNDYAAYQALGLIACLATVVH